MAPETSQIILGFIVALFGGGGIWALITYLFNRRSSEAKAAAETDKAKAETDKVEAETRSAEVRIYGEMQTTIDNLVTRMTELYRIRAEDRAKIDQLEAEIRELKRERIETDAEVARLRRTVTYYRSGVRKLIEQLRASGVDPVWEPSDSSMDESGDEPFPEEDEDQNNGLIQPEI